LPGPDIFISYNREDVTVAQAYRDALAREGYDVWWDATLRSGETYDEVTEAALRAAKAVVVLWSPRSVASRWVRSEATIADRNKTLLPVTIEPCDRPVMFELTQTADLSRWSGQADDTAWQVFLGEVRRMVGIKTTAENTVTATPMVSPRDAASDMPIVAILPIACRADGHGLDWLPEELTEEVTRELSQCSYCKVIAASTMAAWYGRVIDHRALAVELDAAYLVEGKLSGIGEALRLTIQLIGTESDSVLWSSRFSSQLDEIRASPEQLSLNVATGLSQAIVQAQINRALAKQRRCSAWEHVLRTWGMIGRLGGSSPRAVEESRQAVRMAPDFGLAYATLAHALSGRLGIDRLTLSEPEREAIAAEALDAIRKAIELDGQNPAVLVRLANGYAGIGDAEAGLRLAQRAVQLAPHSAEAQSQFGISNFMLGRTSEAIQAFERQSRFASFDPDRAGGQALLGICLFLEGRSAEAEVAIDNALALQPNFYLALRWKAVVAADLGNEESAKAAVRLIRKAEPGKSIDDYLDSPRHLPIEHPRKYEAIDILRRLLEDTEGGA
jgi:TolB-like protein